MAIDARPPVPRGGPPARRGSRRRPLGRRLLTAAVLGWFALLILVPTVALVREALAGGLAAVLEALASARGAAGVPADAGDHACVATVVNTVFGLAFAVVLVRHGSGARRWPTAWSTCPSRSRRSSRA